MSGWHARHVLSEAIAYRLRMGSLRPQSAAQRTQLEDNITQRLCLGILAWQPLAQLVCQRAGCACIDVTQLRWRPAALGSSVGGPTPKCCSQCGLGVCTVSKPATSLCLWLIKQQLWPAPTDRGIRRKSRSLAGCTVTAAVTTAAISPGLLARPAYLQNCCTAATWSSSWKAPLPISPYSQAGSSRSI